MGIPQQLRTAFRERVKDERNRRNWTQAEVARMLSDKGIDNMRNTAVAKIESGEREVKLDEAVGFADLFGVSLDSLLGRKAGAGDDLAFAFRGLRDVARQSMHEISLTVGTLRERWTDLTAFEFDGRSELEALVAEAGDALMNASSAMFHVTAFELSEGADVQPSADLVQQRALELLLQLSSEEVNNEAES
ncbi:helix-turn-helix domain-containing protein [Mycobacterium sp. ITM-2016-00318]|uniref:helix-turn-helix domain-containing protein n=1 Tax=Mycobacterium sp. ITM-2016-00318 TaxID=2099693 RepID=UPI001304B889|nr:helix-turn-helix transcriptional regulator [Mycobacterium sp. ITM-2016-00318]WNG95298.1 helix-turn-helix transcriptional regulator [Mycobacterium sp. ITM-2016-00318]